jgi:Dolichyl-phosphate-mannose-protein mannosyltransferase
MRIAVGLYVLALAVRGILIAHFPDPAYPDSYYYVEVARSLAAGHGFNVDFIWVFVEVGGRLPANPHLPIPSNAHWLPLASLVQWPFIGLFGVASTWVADAPFALIGALAAPLTWAIAREAGARPAVQVGAGILAAVPGLLTPFMGQPDNFGLYQPLVAGALWLTARGLRGDGRSFAIAGLLVGLATLARNDGILVAGTLGLAVIWDRWRAWRSAGMRRPAIPAWAIGLALVGFFVIMGPWWVRQLQTFGSLSPSSSSGRILFIRSMADMNSVVSDVSLNGFLSQGIGSIVESRVLGFVAAVGIFSVLVCGAVLVPFLVIGSWARRRSTDFGPYFVYAAILFAFSAIVSAIHVPGGTFIHSAVALAPHAYILSLEGIVVAVGWIARRRSAWQPEQAGRVFIGAAVFLLIALAVVYTPVVHATWTAVEDPRVAAGAWLDEHGAPRSDPLMTIDAGGFAYLTGHPGVVTVDDPLPTVETVARAYDIRWLVLERESITRSLTPILQGGPRPDWIGPPVLTIPATAAQVAEGDATPTLVMYPVCTTAADTRCSP